MQTYTDTYTYTDSSASTLTAEESAALSLAILGFTAVLIVITYVISAFFLGKIFKKAGEKPWKAWVPVYNNWTMLEIGGQQGFWAILAMVPFLNIVAAVFMYIAGYHIGLKLQKEGWFILVLVFVPIVWLIWLGADKSTWQADGVNVASSGFTPPPVPPMPEGQPGVATASNPGPAVGVDAAAPSVNPPQADLSPAVEPPLQPIAVETTDPAPAVAVEPAPAPTIETTPEASPVEPVVAPLPEAPVPVADEPASPVDSNNPQPPVGQ